MLKLIGISQQFPGCCLGVHSSLRAELLRGLYIPEHNEEFSHEQCCAIYSEMSIKMEREFDEVGCTPSPENHCNLTYLK